MGPGCRCRRPGSGADAQQHGPAQTLAKTPVQRVAIVYPKRGSLSSCEKAARKLLDAFLAKHGLKPAGPLRIIPWVEIDEEPQGETPHEGSVR